MKKILTVILGLVAITSLYAANTEVARLTLTGQGGVENSYITLRVDPTVTTAQTGAFFQNTDLDGNVNLYISNNTEKYSSYKKDNLTNLPLEVITNRREAANQHYTITFNVPTSTVGLKLKDLKTGDNVDIVNNGTYEFDVNTTLHPNYVEGTNYVISGRFVINFEATYLKGSWDSWTDAIEFVPQGNGTAKATLDLSEKGEGYYTFKVNEGANWYGNTTTFKRDYLSEANIINNEDMTFWMDAKGVYYFIWAYATNTITIEYPALPAVTVKGAGDFYGGGYDVVLTPAADELTATGSYTFTASDKGKWYNFKVLVGSEWRSNESEFSRTTTSADWINDELTNNMYFEIDQAGEYTFTWSFVNNQLTIGFPAPVVYSVTTNEDGWASYSSDIDLLAPAGLTIYEGALNGDELTLTQKGYVKANQGVIVKGEAGQTYVFTAGSVDDPYDNILKPSSAWASHSGTIYCLRHVDGEGTALYQYTGSVMPANKAYLEIIATPSSPAPRRISFRFNQPTAIENAKAADVKAEKFVGEDGQILIKRGNEIFNLQGQMVK